MSIEAALAVALIITCTVAFGICVFAKWHKKQFLRIPYWRINEYRITPRFTVGSDAK